MTKDFLSNSGAYIRLLILLFILINKGWAQILPPSVGVHHKKSSSVSDESYVLDFNNNDTCGNDCTTSFYAEVPWSNMSTYSVSMWVKSGESNPSQFRAFFNTYEPNSKTNDGFQMDSGGGDNPRYRYYYANGNTLSYGDNSLVTTWVHLAVVADGSQNETRLYYNGELVSGATFSGVEERWNQIEIGRNRKAGSPGNYYLDEIRVWSAALSESDIKAWMHKPLDNSHTNYSNLEVYFQMNQNSISGTTLLDVSGNDNNATMYNSSLINTSTSYVPVVDLISGYQNNVEAIWISSGTADSDASNGLSMNVSSTLAEANFAVFGNNNSSGTTTDNLPSGQSLLKRSSREWQLEESGTVTVNIKIDISDATGNNIAPAAASKYKLLYKSCSMCDYSIEASGSSISSTDNITFSSVAIKDGFYSIGSTDNNL